MNDYSIEETDEQIVIKKPQMIRTEKCLKIPLRKDNLEDDELGLILMMAMKMYEVSK